MAQPRDLSVDLARGLACLLMVQTHAFHGWVAAVFHAEPWFALTRWLGAFPLPGFLLFSGVSVALRVRSGIGAGESAGHLRRALGRRALWVVALGYATNVLWALLDGAVSWRRVMHADVLHAIGLSLLVVALLIVPTTDGRIAWRRLRMMATWSTLAIAVASPFVTRLTRDLDGGWRYLVAPWSEVRGVTAMPLLPLGAWCGLGVVLGLWLTDAPDPTVRQRRITTVGLVGALSLVLGNAATAATTTWLDEPLSRASLALWPNLVEGAGRGLCLLWGGAWLSRWSPPRVQRVLARYGVASLWIYVVHVPFCYGRLAGPLRAKLSLQSALPLVLVLIVVSYGVALVQRRMLAARHG